MTHLPQRLFLATLAVSGSACTSAGPAESPRELRVPASSVFRHDPASNEPLAPAAPKKEESVPPLESFLLDGPRMQNPAPAEAASFEAGPTQDVTEPAGPWRLGDAAGLPSWLTVRVEQRTRYEYENERFRILGDGSYPLWALRTLVFASVRHGAWRLTGEFMDSRAYDSPDDALLTTGIVNAAELLQGFVGLELEDAIADGDRLDTILGRHTFNIGSRRLVARNRFRNTINAFTGINSYWEGDSGANARAFFTLPVRRLPFDQESLRDNDIEFDEEQEGTYFYGLHGALPLGNDRLSAEAYAYRLDEEDRDFRTRDRDLWTLGGRLLRRPEAGSVDFEWESVIQFGDSRRTPADVDTTDLDHLAHFHHLSAGYKFTGDAQWHLEALFDYASGDRDPDDDENNRFDTLYGARRFEFGPTGVFGAFARANLMTPGVRLRVSPGSKTKVMLAYRLYYLASKKDSWVTTGIIDPNGDSGRYIGSMPEIRVRYEPFPKNLRIEGGIAYLFTGEFVEEAPNSPDSDDVLYIYLGTTFYL